MSLLAGVRVPLPVPWERLWLGLRRQERDIPWVRRVAVSLGKSPAEGVYAVEEAIVRGDVIVVRGRDDRRILRMSPEAVVSEPEPEPEAPEAERDAQDEEPAGAPDGDELLRRDVAEQLDQAFGAVRKPSPAPPAPPPRAVPHGRAPTDDDILAMLGTATRSPADLQQAWEEQTGERWSTGSIAQRMRQMVHRGLLVRIGAKGYCRMPAVRPDPPASPSARPAASAPPLAALILGVVYGAGGAAHVERLIAALGAMGIAPGPAYRELGALRRAGLLVRTPHRQYKLPDPEPKSPLERAAARVAKAEQKLAEARAELRALLGDESGCQGGSASAH